MRLLVATTNLHKLSEIRAILTGIDVELQALDEWPDLAAPEETGATFGDNAREKALCYAGTTGRTTVADDSGLEIDGLQGEPGVHSARFNGETYPEKFQAIYARLGEAGQLGCPARFVCALAVARGTEVLFETQGTVEGRIAEAPAGEAGFGYDPIFFYPPYGKTLAEVSREEKAAVSHRGRAVRQLREWLETPNLLQSGQ
ncbi:MAG: RdgB/HAM1 family non-canonical purine NTP pyrophosphatase [Vicinamibacterales bacterium]|jgi:XTP/dITP diphosphohydrolase|nr:non-canonical purine NTP pyrophosphatase, RdgB/HAM1 family [Acidobacteriota bacterium]MDP6373451.1 RdgB/HAM1 family non-canonical purine NTP pyrophosphatase [Vicinamibacterales bacterium]MDP6607585.1 RdgB/HAM1 family non-canonical purine NTP pyrophosphatase [Vicinamibacterales bacterium]MQG57509.1 RdgB/HAM1 family non-canonical purine NTP pyrophosphatase [SAR202 cluster bacterium]HAK57281.1 non-canonical purine NTP pyrophosphatase, RdgB/HAM1 family [Acidobacteriota bacterium]|tara:strand:- start:9157 stop:9759 length:603 start_codon:yes stop_codon:yes gene_type:complete